MGYSGLYGWCEMRYVIHESFDKSELNHYFESDMFPKAGLAIRTRSGKWYRIKDVGWTIDPFDHSPSIKVLLTRIRPPESSPSRRERTASRH
jgi:hypothetical protein